MPAHSTHEQHVKARRQALKVPNGQVIAQLTLFFWKRLFPADYEASLWRPVLKRVFPDKTLRRADVAVQLEHLYQTRNRIAHHEPVYGRRLRDGLGAVDLVVTRPGQPRPNPETPPARLVADDRRVLGEQTAALQARLDALSAGDVSRPVPE